MKKRINLILIFFFLLGVITGQKPTKWRGPNGNGIYPDDNLLKEWPEKGPDILWHFDELGEGFSSPAFANDKVYVSGMVDTIGYIYILSLKGDYIKKVFYSAEFSRSYPGSRSTPTVVGNLIYMHTGLGKVVCIEENSGEIKWAIDLFNQLDGKNTRFGMTESLLIDGDKVFISPGGEEYNVVAVNRFTGDLIWSSRAKGGISAYCTPLLVGFKNAKLLITMMANDIIALDSETGKLIWSFPYKNQRSIHPNTPIYHNGGLICFSGYGYGGIKLNITDDGTKVSKAWWSDSLESKIGGAVLLDGKIYCSGDNTRKWFCIDWETGKTLYSSNEIAKGSVISADGMLYCYSDKGELALVKPNSEKFEMVSKTTVEYGSAQHWAHPVINNRILYIRHGNSLIAYNLNKN